ncbi:hypothetical protein BG616_12435 [Bacillus subtilis]|nr:hypothetical protein BG616_12435 [Bacillus subtilis]
MVIKIEDTFKQLLTSLGFPGAISAAGFLIVQLIRAGNPVTMFSSSIVEKKFYSKEQLLIIRLGIYCISVLIWTLGFVSIAQLISSYNPNFNWLEIIRWISIAGIMLVFIFLLLYIFIEKIKGKPLKIFIAIIYLIILLYFYTGLNGLILSFQFETNTQKIVVFFISVYFSCYIPALLKPIFNFNKTTKVYIKDGKETWYILHSINREYLLLGNESNHNLCSKTMIKKKEDLYDKPIEIKIEKNNT